MKHIQNRSTDRIHGTGHRRNNKKTDRSLQVLKTVLSAIKTILPIYKKIKIENKINKIIDSISNNNYYCKQTITKATTKYNDNIMNMNNSNNTMQ